VQRWVLNPPLRWLLGAGLVPGYALLETTGRRTGLPRRVPVGDGLVSGTDTFWLIAEHGHHAAYVRNIEGSPRVRVRLRRGWRTGTAHVLEDDDPIARQESMPRANARAVRMFGTQLLTIRIDLDPAE
jgi:deazaflavin-dependent oxidoreductase (nitroreductase family)